MKNLRFSALLALVLIASIGSLQAGSIPTQITSSGTITVPGSYVLANDITGANGIAIAASDVTLNLNGHTINCSQGTGIQIGPSDAGGFPLVNARVSNGRIIGSYGVVIYGSDCLITGLNITISESGSGIDIKNSQFNRVHNCVLSVATGQTGSSAFNLFLASHNTIQNNTLAGIYVDAFCEDDQAGTFATVVGDNTFSGNQFAIPTP
jgi:Right handed beta helix region